MIIRENPRVRLVPAAADTAAMESRMIIRENTVDPQTGAASRAIAAMESRMIIRENPVYDLLASATGKRPQWSPG